MRDAYLRTYPVVRRKNRHAKNSLEAYLLETKINTHDFSTLFAYLWYEDFPLDGSCFINGGISDWKYHTALTFKKTINAFGYFSQFESDGRFDGVARNVKQSDPDLVMLAEWEWNSPKEGIFNEVEKLSKAAENKKPEACFLLTYSDVENLGETEEFILDGWNAECPLIFAIVTYRGGLREFIDLVFYEKKRGEDLKCLRKQPALPWKVKNTKWAAMLKEN